MVMVMVVIMVMVVMLWGLLNRVAEHAGRHTVQHGLALAPGDNAMVHALADVAVEEFLRIGAEHLSHAVHLLHRAAWVHEHLLLARDRIKDVLELEVVPHLGEFGFLALGLVLVREFRLVLLQLLVNGGVPLHEQGFRKLKIVVQPRQLLPQGEPVAGLDVLLTRTLEVGLGLLPQFVLVLHSPLREKPRVQFGEFHVLHGIERERVVRGLARVGVKGLRERDVHLLGFLRAHPQQVGLKFRVQVCANHEGHILSGPSFKGIAVHGALEVDGHKITVFHHRIVFGHRP